MGLNAVQYHMQQHVSYFASVRIGVVSVAFLAVTWATSGSGAIALIEQVVCGDVIRGHELCCIRVSMTGMHEDQPKLFNYQVGLEERGNDWIVAHFFLAG